MSMMHFSFVKLSQIIRTTDAVKRFYSTYHSVPVGRDPIILYHATKVCVVFAGRHACAGRFFAAVSSIRTGFVPSFS